MRDITKQKKIVTDWSEFDGLITKAEATCQCGCGTSFVSYSFARKLYRARLIASIPFRFSSICRCPVHNRAKGGADDSAHLTTLFNPCEAADIKFQNDRVLFIIIRALVFVGFTRIGINRKKKFVHVDSDTEKDQCVLFSY